MRAIQNLLLVVVILAGIVGVVAALEYLPIPARLLPGWVSDLLPTFGSSASGWFIAITITVLVAAGLGVGFTQRAVASETGE